MRALGRYRLDTVVGSGAFATVWRGYDPELETTVAIKLLADNWALDADVRARFLTEARLLRRTVSPRVVRVHDVGIADDRPYFVMDFIGGGTLADRIGEVDTEEAVRLAAAAAEAVQALHDAGFLHRDLKPSNLLVDDSAVPSHVLVADLGSAKLLADASGITVTTGTPAYMVPEQVDGSGRLDERTDVYALGVLATELITGRRPSGGIAAVSASGEPVDPAVQAVLRAALDPDPRRRPARAHAFAEALTEAADGRPLRGWPAGLVWAVAIAGFVAAAVVAWLL